MIVVFPQLLFALIQHIKNGFDRKRKIKQLPSQQKSNPELLNAILLELCGCSTIGEVVQSLQRCFQEDLFNSLSSHCFDVDFEQNEPATEFYLKQRVETCVFSKDLLNKQWRQTSISIDDGLRRFISSGDDVILLTLTPTGNTNTAIVFVICGATQEPETSQVNLILQHASTCFSRILQQHNSSICKSTSPEMQLSEELINAVDATEMQVMLNLHLVRQTSCELSCILLVSEELNQITCQVIGASELDYEVCFPVNEGLFGSICKNRQWISIQDRCPQIEELFNVEVHSALCVPVTCKTSDATIGIICLCNKTSQQCFTTADVAAVTSVMSRSWAVLSSSLVLQKEKKVRGECEAMLLIARKLFSRLDDVSMLLGEIIQEARSLTNAERCSVFLVDSDANELVAKVFDGIVTMDENMNEVRIPLGQGIAGQVATTGKTLNIKDAYAHPLFYRGIDNATGFRTRNILCFPIKDHNGVVVGVSQLCNKIKGPCFTPYDEELAEKFAVFSGISISHSLLYKEVQESQSRSRLANELMTYHMKVDIDDVERNLPRSQLSLPQLHSDFGKFIYPPRSLHDNLKIKACITMYDDLGLTSKFHIPMRTLVHFLLMVRKGYRDPPYHNFDHAFSVMHHAYLLARNLKLNKKLSDVEVIALLTASICHDLDHRGTNNAFQVNSHSVLASLYSSEGSVLERHHFAQAMCILNTSGCNIFENMNRKEYARTLDLIKQIILATDVASHLRILPQLEVMAQEGMDLSVTHQRELLLALCMTACDLSDQTKGWETTKNTAKLIYKEFFSQGDMEKGMGNSPEVIYDREKACVPQLQINFMLHIALPVYSLLARLFPSYEEVLHRVEMNIARWRKVLAEFSSRDLPNTDSLDFLTDEFDRDLFAHL